MQTVVSNLMEFKVFMLQVPLLQLTVLLTPSSILGLEECNFPAIFNFGDSYSDTGGYAAAFGQLPPPFGRTFFNAPAGRFSDGRLLIDFIAESLELHYLSAFLDAIGPNFSHGANFATAGSTIRPQNSTYPLGGFSPFSLDVQYIQYSDFLRRSQIIREQDSYKQTFPELDDFSRALYTFEIGYNDLTDAYKRKLTIDQVKAIIPDLMTQFSHVIKLVYGRGGRSFWIHNNNPMGCLTYFTAKLPKTATEFDEYGCYIPYNNVSQYFNLKLKETVLQLREELPDAAITYVDIYSIKYNLFSQAKQLGFEDPLLVCCGWGEGEQYYNKSFKCIQTKVINGTVIYAKSCENPSRRINWDGIHFSEAANKYVFNQLVDGLFSDPPVPLKFACNKGSSLSLK